MVDRPNLSQPLLACAVDDPSDVTLEVHDRLARPPSGFQPVHFNFGQAVVHTCVERRHEIRMALAVLLRARVDYVLETRGAFFPDVRE